MTLIKVTENNRKAEESHSIDHLLRPTDSFVVGVFKLQQQRHRY
jgi:hypothetical protein